jgi:serine/threonine-protein kinase
MTSHHPNREKRRVHREPLQAVGHYRLLRLLAHGGMSEVYLGYDLKARQLVAVKVLSDDLADDRVQVNRFEREAELSTQLNHPNIVRGFDQGRDEATGRYYLVLEFVDGPSAQDILNRSGRMSVSDVVHIGLALAKALKHLHDRYFIHRDIKPDNILLAPNGDAKLTDLGLVKWGEPKGTRLTAHAEGFGTSHYMPPEQIANAHFVDERSDIFALGATLYHLLTGQVPFPGDTHKEVTRVKSTGVFTPPSHLNPEVPPVLEDILTRMLHTNPRRRYRKADQVISALLRSRLIKGLPNFVPQDGTHLDLLSAEVATLSQPTQPKLRVEPDLSETRAKRWWYLRFRNRLGKAVTRKATTARIVKELENGRLRTAIATRQLGGRYRPLADFPEFHGHFPEEPASKPVPVHPPPRLSCWYRRMLTGLGFSLFALASIAGLYRCFWHHS